VPAALLMILLLLYISFQSMTESLLIFSAIPFAAVGGVFALVLRGMPFSISASVGFIALFGVAVLNGLVLIGHYNLLEKENNNPDTASEDDNIEKDIPITGALDRFRPVIMTATVASLGFLPMALANGAGAEVQKPLATVVIGGLLSSTLLTLILLPVVYAMLKSKIKIRPKAGMVLLLILAHTFVFSQNNLLADNNQGVILSSEQEAIDLALKNNLILAKNQVQIEQAKRLLPTAKTIAPTDFFVETPQLYMAPDQSPIWTTIGAQQTFRPKKVYQQNERVLKQNIKVVEAEQAINTHDISHQARQLYGQCLFTKAKLNFLIQQDSLFAEYSRVAHVEYKVGKITALEKLNMERFYQNFTQILRGSVLDNQNALSELSVYLKVPQITLTQAFTPLDTSTIALIDLPIQTYYRENVALQGEKISQQKLATAPQYLVSISQYVFNQWVPPVIRGGVSIPLWKKSYNAALDAANLDYVIAQKEMGNKAFELQAAYQKSVHAMRQSAQEVRYYESIALPQTSEVLKATAKTRQLGDITAFQYLETMRQAFDIQLGYWQSLKNYNEAVLQVLYFSKK
jgi:heavy metal efflux system protein